MRVEFSQKFQRRVKYATSLDTRVLNALKVSVLCLSFDPVRSRSRSTNAIANAILLNTP
jgi:hypothetical protein